MSAKFVCDGNVLEISDFWYEKKYTKEDYPRDSGFQVSVRSNGFAGYSVWIFGLGQFQWFVGELEKMNLLCKGQAYFDDFDSGSEILFEMKHTGHIRVSGTLREDYVGQRLDFEFTGDQTALGPFVDGLKEFLKQ